ncbi:HpcH/HpaI aldolase family protein [Novosphingobium terrae]|uniref:HpcH/HpaI aldolase family protein n=1 Tax=Novosphingobium terrae TaxID=2726189 RepID=UPI00197EB2A1|nr:HpcH/HpaI aldolase/citrate lyase family protein [Novosphingobium terrae]
MSGGSSNRFKAALGDRQRQIGLWLGLAVPYVAELCGNAGFDWVLVDGEHGPNTLRTVLTQLQALQAGPAEPVVRALSDDPNLIKQLLDIGAHNLLVPMIETGAQAYRLVAATRYPPLGTRGVGSALARASDWGRCKDYLATAHNDLCVIVQIETPLGVKNARQIIETEGIDGVFIGLSDLAATMGLPGQPGHPEVLGAFREVAALAQELGKPFGTLASSSSLASEALQSGCTFLAVGSDVGLLVQAAGELLGKYRRDAADRPAADVY